MNRKDQTLLYLFAAIVGFTFINRTIADPDLGWHLLGGEWTFKHREVPSADFINAFNPEWVDYHWLGQLVLYSLYSLGGFPLLKLSLGILMALTFTLIVDMALRYGHGKSEFAVVTSVITVSWALLYTVVSIRPQSISVLFIAFALREILLNRHKRELFVLCFLTMLLANIHVYWIFIPILWVIFRVLPRLIDRRYTGYHTWGCMAILLACGFVSPYGIKNIFIVWEYLSVQPAIQGTVRELRSSIATGDYVPSLVLLILIVVVRFFRQSEARKVYDITALFFLGIGLSLIGVKFLSVFALFLVPYLVQLLSRLALGVNWLPNERAMKSIVGVVCVGLLGVTAWNASWTKENEQTLNSFYPIEACKVVGRATRAIGKKIVVATHFNDGGWCRWALKREQPEIEFLVTTDGRTQFVPNQHFVDCFDFYSARERWHEVLSKWAPHYIVAPKVSALSNLLPYHTKWGILYEDEKFRVFLAKKLKKS